MEKDSGNDSLWNKAEAIKMAPVVKAWRGKKVLIAASSHGPTSRNADQVVDLFR